MIKQKRRKICRKAAFNGSLSLAAIGLVIVCSFIAEYIAGRFTQFPQVVNELALIFPAGCVQHFETEDFSYTAACNSLGLREREIKPGKSTKYRILALGDSFTYGWGVDEKETWLRLLEDLLRQKGLDVETVNAGKPGEGPPYYAELAEKAIPLLQPDLVLVGVLQGNDLLACGQSWINQVKKKSTQFAWKHYPNLVWLLVQRGWMNDREVQKRGGAMAPVSAEFNRKCAADSAKNFLEKMSPETKERYDRLDDAVKNAFLAGRINPFTIQSAVTSPDIYLSPLALQDSRIQSCENGMTSALRKISGIAAAYRAQVTILSIPNGPYVNIPAYETMQRMGFSLEPDMLNNQNADKPIRHAAEALQLPFIDATQAFVAKKDDATLYFKLDEHFAPAGHRLFAETIAPEIAAKIAASQPR